MNQLIKADLQSYEYEWRNSDQALSTLKTYRVYLDKFHEQYPEGIAGSTSLHDAREFLAQFKPSVRYMAWRALKSFSKWYAHEYEVPDPLAKLGKVKQPTPTKVPMAQPEDIQKLLDSIDDSDVMAKRDRAIILVLSTTGMRRSEVARMRVADVDLVSGTVEIQTSKNGETRTTRMSQEAIRAVRKYLHTVQGSMGNKIPEHLWISATRREQMTSQAIRQMLVRRSETAGVKISAHAFRRGFAMRFIREGGSETMLREMAGWKKPEMVEVYTRQMAKEEALAQHKSIFG